MITVAPRGTARIATSDRHFLKHGTHFLNFKNSEGLIQSHPNMKTLPRVRSCSAFAKLRTPNPNYHLFAPSYPHIYLS
ncbi:hypothetical protein glysoja_018517 [Glycine soja]|nr:hypothetical protein glysoja_018517 [Glycine soja]